MDLNLYRRFREWIDNKVGEPLGKLAMAGYDVKRNGWYALSVGVGDTKATYNCITGRFDVLKDVAYLNSNELKHMKFSGYGLEGLVRHLQDAEHDAKHWGEMNDILKKLIKAKEERHTAAKGLGNLP